MILDRFGDEIVRPEVRMSLGFVRKELPAGEPETLNGVTPPRVDDGENFANADDRPWMRRR